VRHLWVLRHAKAASAGPDGDDHGRPLTGRGRRQTTQVRSFVAGRLASGATTPDLVICSSAVRARQTAEPVHEALGAAVPLDIERSLYGADPDDIVTRLRLVSDEIGTVMIVGHNPSFHELVLLLVSADDAEGRARLETGFPTAALAIVALEVTDWSSLGAGGGRLEELFVPTR
jgi:phosphohistidine phosphatase